MGVTHPKPTFHGGQKPPYGPFLEWVERQIDGVLSSAYPTLREYVESVAAAIDLSAILADISDLQADVTALTADVLAVEGDVADHETRIDAIEAADAKYRTTIFQWRGSSLTQTSGNTYYIDPYYGEGGGSVVNYVDASMRCGRAGTYKNLRFYAESGTPSCTVGFVKNGTPATTSITATANSTLYSDTTNSITVAIGDSFAISHVNTALNAVNDYTVMFDFEEA